jgi:hypothetical protein
MSHWLKSMLLPLAIMIVGILCAHSTAQSAAQDAMSETKLAEERGEFNHTHYAQPTKIARVIRTVHVCSYTSLIETDDLIERLKNTKGFQELDLVLVEDPRKADVLIVANHIPFTFDYTLKATDAKTSVNIASARATVFNGYIASVELSKELVRRLAEQRTAAVKTPSN